MSNLQGRFKGRVTSFFTSKQGEKPRVSVSFNLIEEKEGDDWITINPETSDANGCFEDYWLIKEVKEGKTTSAYDYSLKKFKEHWGFGLDEGFTAEQISEKILGEIKELQIEQSDYPGHKIKYVNRLKGQKREGAVDLSDLL